RNAWHHDDRGSAEGLVLRKGPQIFDAARGDARRSKHSGERLHAFGRWHYPAAADLPPLLEAAQTDDAARRSALLRPLRAARRLGESRLLARRGAEARAGRGSPA